LCLQASVLVGKLLAERAQQAGISAVHWDRKYGQKYHGKVKELLVSMQEAGLPLN
jgi:large subunit ribosomal protein L18